MDLKEEPGPKGLRVSTPDARRPGRVWVGLRLGERGARGGEAPEAGVSLGVSNGFTESVTVRLRNVKTAVGNLVDGYETG